MLPFLTMWLVYALYGRRTWSCVFATCAVLIECVTTIAFLGLALPVVTYDAACVMVPIPKSILVYIIGTSITQTVLLWLAFRKWQRVARGGIACVTIRDGMLAFMCMSGK